MGIDVHSIDVVSRFWYNKYQLYRQDAGKGGAYGNKALTRTMKFGNKLEFKWETKEIKL